MTRFGTYQDAVLKMKRVLTPTTRRGLSCALGMVNTRSHCGLGRYGQGKGVLTLDSKTRLFSNEAAYGGPEATIPSEKSGSTVRPKVPFPKHTIRRSQSPREAPFTNHHDRTCRRDVPALYPHHVFLPQVTIKTIAEKYEKKEAISMLTAYDALQGRVASSAGVDMILVGDSLGMVVLGRPDTVSVTLEEIRHHAKAVVAGSSGPLIIGDLPFGSYVTPEDAARNSISLLKESGVDVVKLEGGTRVAPHVSAIVDAGVAVCGHIGLTPQSHAALGGMVCQGRSSDAAMELLEDALALQKAGCFCIVLECIPDKLASFITDRLSVPTIGIGAGGGTSGQVHSDFPLLAL